MKIRLRQVLVGSAAALAAALLALQLVPYGRRHENPPTVAEPSWDSARTRALATRACFDCHSNETQWPWYSHVAPASWLLQRNVDHGRGEVNFSEWGRSDDEHEIVEVLAEGEMPPGSYLLLHPEARLSTLEKQDLVRGLGAKLAASTTAGRRGRSDD
jgi:mono/diheme cytochrome c family protein